MKAIKRLILPFLLISFWPGIPLFGMHPMVVARQGSIVSMPEPLQIWQRRAPASYSGLRAYTPGPIAVPRKVRPASSYRRRSIAPVWQASDQGTQMVGSVAGDLPVLSRYLRDLDIQQQARLRRQMAARGTRREFADLGRQFWRERDYWSRGDVATVIAGQTARTLDVRVIPPESKVAFIRDWLKTVEPPSYIPAAGEPSMRRGQDTGTYRPPASYVAPPWGAFPALGPKGLGDTAFTPK